jgi:very-short-patch-repair endonuclease
MPKDKKEARANAQREHMMSLSEKEKATMRTKAMKAIRNARDVGSKLEQAIMMALRDKGLTVEFHRKNLVANEKLEADIYLPDLRVVIESDGPSHRENIFGRLKKQRFADSVKNGLLMQHDFVVIRVVDSAKTNSQAYNRRMCAKIEAIIDSIQNVTRPTVLNVEDN